MSHLRKLVNLVAGFLLYALSWAQPAVNPVVSTAPTAGNADDPAIWIHPTDPARSVIIGTDKDAGIYVWDMNGNQLQHLPQGTRTNNVDVRYGFQLGGRSVDIVAANLRQAGKLAVFVVDRDHSAGAVLSQIADVNSPGNDIQKDSYGFTLYRRKADGTLYVFERPKSGGRLRQYRIEDDGTGAGVRVVAVRELNYSGGTAEGFMADDDLGFVYITEEARGIHKYLADPDASADPVGFFAAGDDIAGDREGLGLYACSDGSGYLVLSSQGNSTIKIYDRRGDNAFLKTVTPLNEKGKAGLGTDGLDVTSFAAPPNFPNGLVAVHDESGSRYHIYDWADFAGTDLVVCVDGGTGAPPADRTPPASPTNVRVEIDR